MNRVYNSKLTPNQKKILTKTLKPKKKKEYKKTKEWFNYFCKECLSEFRATKFYTTPDICPDCKANFRSKYYKNIKRKI